MRNDTVFIVDDDASVRDSISLLVSLRGYASATFASAEDFLGAMKPDWRGCAVLDIRMPGMSGLDLQRSLLERNPNLAVIVITAHGDVAAAREAFLSRAFNFLEKPFEGDELLAAIDGAMKSTHGRRNENEAPGNREPATDRLSPREREVMHLLVRGLHNRRIAEELQISPRTVEVHKARVMEKLGVRNLVELVRLMDSGRPQD